MGRTHVVKQGERLATIADMYGVSPTIIYADPDNAELWKKRPNPNQLMPGDEVSLGDPNRPSDLPTGAGHTLMISTGDDETLSIFLGSRTDASYAGRKFELKVGDRTVQDMVPDDNVIVADIALGSDAGELKVWLSDDPEVIATWTLQIGHLDPINEVSGVQARLNNLGYDAGDVDGNEDEDFQAAVAAFQDDVGLAPSGQVDDDFRAALDQAHDEQKFPPEEPEGADPDDETFEWEYSFAEMVDDGDGDDDGEPAAADSGGGLWGEVKKILGFGQNAGAGIGASDASAAQPEDEAAGGSSETSSSDDDDDDEAVDDDGYVETGEEELADASDASDDQEPVT